MESDSYTIYHLTPAGYFNSLPADQPYRPSEFDRDGFIHCTKGEERMLLVADTIYRRVPGEFLALVIDERKVTAPVQYENVGGILFPHIYGALDRNAIVRVIALGRREDGTFLPIGEPDAAAEHAAVSEAWLAQARLEQLLAESADLRAKTIERLARIERDIAALRAPAASDARQAPAAQAAPVTPAAQTALAETVPVSAVVARLERVERSLHQLVARLEVVEDQVAALKKETRKPVARRSPAKRK
jgi:uncharacterized protein (DUF952 family)